MAFPVGNKLWEARSRSGRKPIFSSKEELWDSAVEYFKWVEANPLEEQKLFHYQGEIIKETVSKMRAMTEAGLCVFLGIGQQTFRDYGKRDDFSEVVSDIRKVIYEQKLTGAAADLLNSNIIARDLGLADKRESDHTSSDGSLSSEIKVTVVSPEE